MTDNTLDELVERLRAKAQIMPMQGGGTISAEGGASFYVTDDGKRLVNPDGPEAATQLTLLKAAGDEMAEALARTQFMLEQIVHLHSTNFAEIHERIIANRPALTHWQSITQESGK